MAITLKTDKQGLEIVDNARKKKNWTALSATWCETANVSFSTLKRFREKTAIQKDAFISICQAVGIEDWSIVAARSDSPEATDRRRSRLAQKFVAEEIFSNLSSIDARLYFVEQGLTKANLEQQIETIQAQVAPALVRPRYAHPALLVQRQQIADLRQAFNSRPLKIEINASTLQDLLKGEADPQWMQFFYSRLADVQDASESLLNALANLSAAKQRLCNKQQHYQKQLDLQQRRLFGCAAIAHLSGLYLLQTLNVESLPINNRLKSLIYLVPNQLASKSVLQEKLNAQKRAMQKILEESAALLVEKESILQAQLAAYEQINHRLQVRSLDTWGVVIAKAIMLRQLGRRSEAIAAFKQYAQLFCAEDPTASHYAETAQQFTQQLEKLGVFGGLYIYELVDHGIADRAKLSIGDIVVAYGDRSVTSLENWATAQKLIFPEDVVRITYLHRCKNSFIRKTQHISGGPIGAGLMPI